MFRKLIREESAFAREIDKGQKNLWRFDWLDEVINLSWKDKGKGELKTVFAHTFQCQFLVTKS